MRKEILIIANILLFFVLVALLVVARKTADVRPAARMTRKVPVKAELPAEQTIYDISKMKSEERALSGTAKKTAEEMEGEDEEREPPDSSSPEERAEILERLNKDIEVHKKELEENPKNQRAKGLLFLAESMKEDMLNEYGDKGR